MSRRRFPRPDEAGQIGIVGPVRVRRAFLAGLIAAAIVAAFIFPGSVLASTGSTATAAGIPLRLGRLQLTKPPPHRSH